MTKRTDPFVTSHPAVDPGSHPAAGRTPGGKRGDWGWIFTQVHTSAAGGPAYGGMTGGLASEGTLRWVLSPILCIVVGFVARWRQNPPPERGWASATFEIGAQRPGGRRMRVRALVPNLLAGIDLRVLECGRWLWLTRLFPQVERLNRMWGGG